jgi:hypothetical protein
MITTCNIETDSEEKKRKCRPGRRTWSLYILRRPGTAVEDRWSLSVSEFQNSNLKHETRESSDIAFSCSMKTVIIRKRPALNTLGTTRMPSVYCQIRVKTLAFCACNGSERVVKISYIVKDHLGAR